MGDYEILIGFGGVRIDYAMMNNFDFTLPTISSGLKLAMKFTPKSQLWIFFEPLNTPSWLIIISTALVVGIINFLFEEDVFKVNKNITI